MEHIEISQEFTHYLKNKETESKIFFNCKHKKTNGCKSYAVFHKSNGFILKSPHNNSCKMKMSRMNVENSSFETSQPNESILSGINFNFNDSENSLVSKLNSKIDVLMEECSFSKCGSSINNTNSYSLNDSSILSIFKSDEKIKRKEILTENLFDPSFEEKDYAIHVDNLEKKKYNNDEKIKLEKSKKSVK